ncbi:MAG TPA: hypothetical protein VIA18_00785 [Polyangia bacterium]|jgi:hypothetical protein|nr:hypothetical protein [Polyangia bacterium]
MTKRISLALVVGLSVAVSGCAKKGVGADCGKAVANGVEVQKAHLAAMDEATKDKMKDVALSRCQDDKWSEDVLQCMSEAKADTDFKTCQGKLTPEQHRSMQQAMKNLAAAGSSGKAPANRAGSVGATAGSAGSDDDAAAQAAEHP